MSEFVEIEDGIDITVDAYSLEVQISFDSGDKKHILTRIFDSIDVDKKQRGMLITGMKGNDKTEFKPPFKYKAMRIDARRFWEDLTAHGWEVKESI